MHAEIAFAKRAQDRIGDSVQKRVGIRVAFGAAVRRNVHAAKTSGRPSTRRCVSLPMPMRNIQQWSVCDFVALSVSYFEPGITSVHGTV